MNDGNNAEGAVHWLLLGIGTTRYTTPDHQGLCEKEARERSLRCVSVWHLGVTKGEKSAHEVMSKIEYSPPSRGVPDFGILEQAMLAHVHYP